MTKAVVIIREIRKSVERLSVKWQGIAVCALAATALANAIAFLFLAAAIALYAYRFNG